jgi:membrane-associated HD superfamily phosphohydrolase
MANNTREQLEKRVQKAILQESYLRWESALVIAFTLLLAVFGPYFIDFIPAWGWLIGGAAAEAALVYSSLTDPEFGGRVASSLLHREFQPEQLGDKQLQQQVKQALDYRSRIYQAIRGQSDSLLKDELNQTATQIDDWLENIYDLAQRIDRYQQDRGILERDYKRAQSRVKELSQQLEQASNQDVKAQIQKTLDGNQQQLATLESLKNTIRRADLQLENSLIHLGTIYSQTMLVDAKDIDSGRSRRLRQEIEEEVTEINDVLLAMDEVHSAEAIN